jgi:uncharacterized protein (TIGR02246 family)
MMVSFRRDFVVALLLALPPAGWMQASPAPPAAEEARREIEAFNARLDAAGRRMDNEAVMALWAEDGVDLLPGLEPMVGKKAITDWLQGVKKQLGGFTMKVNETKWHDITLAGEYAFEWGVTHQIVQPPGGAKPAESRGKMLLVLRRSPRGEWLIVREAWTPNPPSGR